MRFPKLTITQVQRALDTKHPIGKYHFFIDKSGNARIATKSKPNMAILPSIFFKSGGISPAKMLTKALNDYNGYFN